MRKSSADSALQECVELFKSTYSYQPTHGASAPGRVNLIGEHTDYNDGFVMPCALEFRTYVVGAKTNSNTIRIFSKGAESAYSVDLKDLGTIPEGKKHWSDYPRGVIAIYKRNGARIPGMDIAIIGKVPQGSGLSSSAALEVATAYFLESLLGLRTDKDKIALIAQKAEHEFAKVRCGIMDQFISSLGKQDHALLLDCRTQVPEYVPITNPDYVFLVISITLFLVFSI